MSHEDGLREHSRNIFCIFLYYVVTTLLTCHLDDDGEHWHPFHREYTGIPALINAETDRQAGSALWLCLHSSQLSIQLCLLDFVGPFTGFLYFIYIFHHQHHNPPPCCCRLLIRFCFSQGEDGGGGSQVS